HYTLLDENLNFSTIDENDVSENEDEYQLKSIPIVKENPTFYDAKVKTYYEQNQNDMLVDENDFHQISSIADQFIIVKGQPENDFIKLDKNFILFISKNSELGKSIINQNVGDSFTYNDSNYKITSKPKLFSETLCWDNSEKNTNFVESYYNTVPSGKSKLLETIKTMESPYIYVVTNLDLENEEPTIRNAKAFIKNGEIYINVDKATDATVVHEFGHLYLAQAKLERGKDYYNLLSQLDGTETYKELSKNSDYTTYKKASDFNEEVLAHMLEHYFNNELDEDSLDYKIVKEQLLPLLSDDFKKLMEGDTIVLPSEFITSNYAREQKVATVKQKLMKLNTLKEDCN
ncbi:MAG: hypothetical protein KBT03_10080, partial [Bacteroidales bacterium]|nr:hypothetical protein [Candidatus Scybalousia scybalohippi]